LSTAEIASECNEFNIFSHRPIQKYEVGTLESAYRPIAHFDQNDLEFFIPFDKDKFRGKLLSVSGKNVNFTDYTTVSKKLLYYLFSHCNVTLNCVTITQLSEHYNCRSYLWNLLTYGTHAAASHLSNAYWYIETDDMQHCSEPMTKNLTATANLGFTTSWDILSTCKEIQLFGR